MRVLLLVGQCHVEVEGAGSLYWLDLLHMGPSPSPHWLCLLHNGPLEPNPLPSNPCLTLLPCVPSVKNRVVGGLAQAAASNMRSTHKEKLTQEHTKRDGGQNVFLLVSSSSSSHFTTYTKCR